MKMKMKDKIQTLHRMLVIKMNLRQECWSKKKRKSWPKHLLTFLNCQQSTKTLLEKFSRKTSQKQFGKYCRVILRPYFSLAHSCKLKQGFHGNQTKTTALGENHVFSFWLEYIPYFDGFDGIYCVNLVRPRYGNNCSSIVTDSCRS